MLLALIMCLRLCVICTGGRGKSTMAKLLYNRLQGAGSFSNSAFVEIQVGDGADKTAQHLACALKGFGATADASEGAPVLSQRLQGFVSDKKLLYVLDNVWTASQLTTLLPTRWGEGSVVIVTTRFESFTDSDIWPQVCGHTSVELCSLICGTYTHTMYLGMCTTTDLHGVGRLHQHDSESASAGETCGSLACSPTSLSIQDIVGPAGVLCTKASQTY
jgi:hypothetical protein